MIYVTFSTLIYLNNLLNDDLLLISNSELFNLNFVNVYFYLLVVF